MLYINVVEYARLRWSKCWILECKFISTAAWRATALDIHPPLPWTPSPVDSVAGFGVALAGGSGGVGGNGGTGGVGTGGDVGGTAGSLVGVCWLAI